MFFFIAWNGSCLAFKIITCKKKKNMDDLEIDFNQQN